MVWNLNRKILLSDGSSFNLEPNKILAKFNSILNETGFRTEVNLNTIKFKRIYKSSTNTGKNKVEAFKILNKGIIRLSTNSSDKIQIICTVSLGDLIFLSGLFGSLFGVFFFINTHSLFTSLLALISIFTIIYLVGFIYLTIKIDSILNSLKKKNAE